MSEALAWPRCGSMQAVWLHDVTLFQLGSLGGHHTLSTVSALGLNARMLAPVVWSPDTNTKHAVVNNLVCFLKICAFVNCKTEEEPRRRAAWWNSVCVCC